MKPKIIRSLFKQESEGKFKDFNLNLLSKDAIKFIKNFNKDSKINLRVVEMPKKFLDVMYDGYITVDIKYKGLLEKLSKIKSVKTIIFIRKETEEDYTNTFWHEVGHLLFKMYIDKKMKKKIKKEFKPVRNMEGFKKACEEEPLIPKIYNFKDFGEEIVCECFSESVMGNKNKLFDASDFFKKVPTIVQAHNILLKQLSLLLSS